MRLTRVAHVPVCLQVGRAIIAEIGDMLASNNLAFQTAVLVSTELIDQKYGGEFKIPFEEKVYIADGDDGDVRRVATTLRRSSHNALVVAFGGGRVIDAGKYAATQTGHHYLSVPATLSNDGIYSPVASIVEEGRRQSLGANIPLGIAIDLDIVAKAPRQTIISGVGDLISKVSALQDWKLAKADGVEELDDFAYGLAYMAANSILNLEFSDVGDHHFLERLAYGLVVSGFAMELAGSSRPCSGSEHMFSHAVDYLRPECARPHGIQVAFGTLLMERWRSHDISRLVRLFSKVGLPTNIEQLGLTHKIVAEALMAAPRMRQRYTILSKMEPTESRVAKLLSEF